MSPKAAASLSPGDRLGPYEIVALLGSGGMGEVYRAHDRRLRRDVALKIVRGSSLDAGDVTRISHEARAAGSLNHPNIVAVFDVGTEGGVPYVVTELLEGETLRDRMDHGAVRYRKALDYGIQIAQALDAAHGKGICHRDVKPANAFITTDGRVKLLDFGIAKVNERQQPPDSQETTAAATKTGEIRGTAGYMSPEQVLGQPVDHRTDIFALGAVLYEMFTGVRPFERPSIVQTLGAVVQDDPADPVTVNRALPPACAAVVRRCLEKNKEERFQSARDLAFGLQQLREFSATANVFASGPGVRRRLMLPAIFALVVGAEAVALWLLFSPRPAPAFEQLTFRRGRISGARFASDAKAVVFSETVKGNEPEVWRLDDLSDSSVARSLDYPAGTDVLAAGEGDLALCLRRRFVLGERFVGTLAVAPKSGGGAHELAENVEDADWDSSGTRLAVARSSGDISGQCQIEYPAGTVLYKTDGSIRFLRVSRDGRRIAFLEDPVRRGVGGHVSVVDRNGKVTTLTDHWGNVRGLAWSASGDEIWFTAGRARADRALRAVDLQGRQRTLLEAPASLTLWDIAPDGRVLLARDEQRRAIIGVPPGQTREQDLSWYDNAGLADLSDDGRLLLFGDRFGVYLRNTDGSAPVRLGLKDEFADDLSPDGTMVLATSLAGHQLIVFPTHAGNPRPLPVHGIVGYQGAWWLPDGRHILFNGNRAGAELRSYIQQLDGGQPRPLTPEKTWTVGPISPDGKWIATITKGTDALTLWPLAGGPSRLLAGSHAGERLAAWSADARSIFLFTRGELPANVFELDVATGRRRLWKTLVPPDSAGVYSIIDVRISAAGDAYFYGYTRMLSQLYLVRHLK